VRVAAMLRERRAATESAVREATALMQGGRDDSRTRARLLEMEAELEVIDHGADHVPDGLARFLAERGVAPLPGFVSVMGGRGLRHLEAVIDDLREQRVHWMKILVRELGVGVSD
jgi:hypothetical protein